MRILRALPGALACLVLGAHFLRAGNGLFVLLALALLVLCFLPRARIAAQIGLAVGSVEWLRTLWILVLERRAEGQPFLRLALILGAVALVTGLSALCLPRAPKA